MKRTLSVIIPTYNSAQTIEKAIQSVISQKSDCVKLIVIDGASSDGTNELIRKYADKIDFFLSEPDKGYADALNKGVNACSTDYFMMLAADDQLLCGCIDKAISALKEETDVWCGASLEKRDYGYWLNRSDPDLNKLFHGCSLRHPATIFKKSTFIKCGGYDISYKCAADRDVFLRLYKAGARFQVENIPMVLFAMTGMSNNDPFKYAVPENCLISRKNGLSEKEVLKDEAEFRKRYKLNRKTLKLKCFLSKIGLLPLTCKIMGRGGCFLNKKAVKKYGIGD